MSAAYIVLAVRVTTGAFILAVLVFSYVVYDVSAHPETYTFGTEIGGWAYASQNNYITAGMISLILALTGLVAGVIQLRV
ncbi:MAG: hypothetical protein ACFB2Z_04605 [Maricaulaceae bacterium]